MSFADWLDESRARFQSEPMTAAASESLYEFYEGARHRLLYYIYTEYPSAAPTTLAGYEASFIVEEPVDVRRARTLLGEEPVLEWWLDGISEDTVVWDVGSYHGHFSVLAALAGANVVAFEPLRENRARIRRNAGLNWVDVDVRSYALSDESTTQQFAVSGPESEGSIRADGDVSIETRRGDDVDPAPEVLKIDVEGHEIEVLRGMTARLGVVDRVVIEVHDGVNPAEVRALLEEVGLSSTEIENDRSQTYIGGVRP